MLENLQARKLANERNNLSASLTADLNKLYKQTEYIEQQLFGSASYISSLCQICKAIETEENFILNDLDAMLKAVNNLKTKKKTLEKTMYQFEMYVAKDLKKAAHLKHIRKLSAKIKKMHDISKQTITLYFSLLNKKLYDIKFANLAKLDTMIKEQTRKEEEAWQIIFNTLGSAAAKTKKIPQKDIEKLIKNYIKNLRFYADDYDEEKHKHFFVRIKNTDNFQVFKEYFLDLIQEEEVNKLTATELKIRNKFFDYIQKNSKASKLFYDLQVFYEKYFLNLIKKKGG